MLKKFARMFITSCVMCSLICVTHVSINVSSADEADITEQSEIGQEEVKGEVQELCDYLKTKADLDGDGHEEKLLLFTRDLGDFSKLEMGYLAVLDDKDDIQSEIFIGCVNMPCDMELCTSRKDEKTYIGFSSNYGIEGGCRGYMILSYEDGELKKEIGIENPGYTCSYGLYLVSNLEEEDHYSDGEQLYDGNQYSEYIDALKEQVKPYGFAIEAGNEEVEFYADERMVPENPDMSNTIFEYDGLLNLRYQLDFEDYSEYIDENTYTVSITDGYLKMRSLPFYDDNVIRELKNGEELILLSVSDIDPRYYRVAYSESNQVGYVHQKYITKKTK